jgi:hypothetical protein
VKFYSAPNFSTQQTDSGTIRTHKPLSKMVSTFLRLSPLTDPHTTFIQPLSSVHYTHRTESLHQFY